MSSALYVKVYKFIYKLDMIFLKTKAEGAGICVLQIILFTQNHAILKTLIKKMLSFQKVFKNVLTFKGLGVRLTLNRLGVGALGAPILVFLP